MLCKAIAIENADDNNNDSRVVLPLKVCLSEGLCRSIEHMYVLLNEFKLDRHFINYVRTEIRCLSNFQMLSRECNLDCCATTFPAPLPPLVAHKLRV